MQSLSVFCISIWIDDGFVYRLGIIGCQIAGIGIVTQGICHIIIIYAESSVTD